MGEVPLLRSGMKVWSPLKGDFQYRIGCSGSKATVEIKIARDCHPGAAAYLTYSYLVPRTC